MPSSGMCAVDAATQRCNRLSFGIHDSEKWFGGLQATSRRRLSRDVATVLSP